MVPPGQTSYDGQKQKNHLDREIREMMTALTTRLSSLQRVHKPGKSTHSGDEDEDEDGHGVSIVTLAGSNVGASMRAEMDEKAGLDNEQEAFATYVNSNFQAFNNSIMLGGSYHTNDPGVHMDISDYMEDEANEEGDNKKRKGKKGKKKKTGSSKSEDHADEQSD